jgi:ATP synthase protein I
MSEERDAIDRPRDVSSGPAGQGSSFEDRLSAARRKQGLEAPRQDEAAANAGVGLSASQGSALGMGMRVGIELVSALAVAVAIGWFLDGWLGTRPWLLMLFFVLGGAAGVANVWRLVSPPQPPAK